MDGVTILNTYMGLTKGDIIFLSLWCSLLGTIGVIYIVAWIVGESDIPPIIVTLALVGVVWFIKFCPRKEHIQAIVDQSVSWTELTERYEVIRVDGRIVTMIEKNEE